MAKRIKLTVSNGHCTIDTQSFDNVAQAKRYWAEEYTKLERKSLHANLRTRGTVTHTSKMTCVGFEKIA